MPSVLITGANRGLGFGLLKYYAAQEWRVFGCCRDPLKAKELANVAAASSGKVTVHRLDVEDHASVDTLAAQLKGQPIDILLNVAGYYGPKIVTEPGGLQKFGESDYADWMKIYKINTMGPMKVCEAFVENVAASQHKKIVNISSIVGSIGTIGHGYGGNMYGYRATKAALNAITRGMAEDLKVRGIVVVALHPGWVRTDMGGPGADIDAAESVAGMTKAIAGFKPADVDAFQSFDGTTLPW
jgi:NAD(P)-dependent dehydrogenase (short-subunit alcohol dehydrogenase family)